MSKSIFDMVHIKSVAAFILLDDKSIYCGRIVANFGDSGNVTAHVCMRLPDGLWESAQASAGGYGYDKLGSAVGKCLNKLGIEDKIVLDACGGRGIDAIDMYFRDKQYQMIRAV